MAEFVARTESHITKLKSVPLAQGFDEIVYPGEIGTRNEARHRAEGLLLPGDTLADLRRLAGELGITSQLAFPPAASMASTSHPALSTQGER